MRACVGEGRIGRARATEFRVDLEALSDVDDDDKGRAAFIGRESARVSLGLSMRAAHRRIPCRGLDLFAGLLGFADEGAALIKIDEAVALAAIPPLNPNASLEDVGVIARIVAGGLGTRQIKNVHEIAGEALKICALAARPLNFGPA